MRTLPKQIRDAIVSGNQEKINRLEEKIYQRHLEIERDREESFIEQKKREDENRIPDGYFRDSLSGKLCPNSEKMGIGEVMIRLNKILDPIFDGLK